MHSSVRPSSSVESSHIYWAAFMIEIVWILETVYTFHGLVVVTARIIQSKVMLGKLERMCVDLHFFEDPEEANDKVSTI